MAKELGTVVLVEDESLALHVFNWLVKTGLRIQVTIDGITYQGWVNNLDLAHGANSAHCTARINKRNPETGDDHTYIKVGIGVDGDCVLLEILPD